MIVTDLFEGAGNFNNVAAIDRPSPAAAAQAKAIVQKAADNRAISLANMTRSVPMDQNINKDVEENYDDEPAECWTCRGTGEGQHEGQTCSVCHGTGVEPGEPDDDFDDFDLDENDAPWPFQQVNELSNEKLTQYKKAAGADATAADRRGDFERGNKRFRGITTATKKQFSNDIKKHYASREQGVAEGSTETTQQQQVRAAITQGLQKHSQAGKDQYQSQPTNRNYFDNAGFASDKLTGIDSIDPDGTVVIALGDTRAADWVKKLAALGGMPGVKTREVQPTQQGVAEEKQRLDPKCWTGYKKQGTKMKGGVRVNNCVPNESVDEAANAAQQAAIAINMKKQHKKPKGMAEDEELDGMALGELTAIVQDTKKIYHSVKNGTPLEAWMYKKITNSNEALTAVAQQINNPAIRESVTSSLTQRMRSVNKKLTTTVKGMS